MSNNLNSIKKYHDALFYAHVTDKEKMVLTTVITVAFMVNDFDTKYREWILGHPDLTPIQALIKISTDHLTSQGIEGNFLTQIINTWNSLSTKVSLNRKSDESQDSIDLIELIDIYNREIISHVRQADQDFLGKLFAEISGKGANTKDGIVLTPGFIANVMVDLLDLDYKTDVVFDGASGSGALLINSYIKMRDDIYKDHQNGVISNEERTLYLNRLNSSVYANDIDAQMALLTLCNFSLFSVDIHNVKLGDFFNIDKNYIDNSSINKGILNPPYEYDSAKFTEHLISRIANSDVDKKNKRVVVICPPQAFGKLTSPSKKEAPYFKTILDKSTLEYVIKVQDNAFVESGVSVGTSIFSFNLSKPHGKDDYVVYYDFSDSGYVYLKDSGLVNKGDTFLDKKELMLGTIKEVHDMTEDVSDRGWNNFFEVPEVKNFRVKLDLEGIINRDKQAADITRENQLIKKMLLEKQELIDSVGNKIPRTDELENYLIDILSEEV